MNEQMMSESLINGDEITFKESLAIWFACCDCGLAHLFLLDKDDNAKPILWMFADDNETIKIRNTKTIEELDFIIKKLQRFRRKKKNEQQDKKRKT